MLYAVIKRFDSLLEITDSMFPEAPKLAQLGIGTMSGRSTLSDANTRRPETEFEDMYRSQYARYKDELSSDSRRMGMSISLAMLAHVCRAVYVVRGIFNPVISPIFFKL